MDGELLERQYRNHLSGYMNWNQLSHAEEWILFEKNIGPYVGIDEVSLSQGELYTILINKERKGRSGSIIAIIKGTDVRTVTSVLLKLPRRRRFQVREITLDMAPNMEQTARICFPAARRVTDRFHVQKLAYEAVQEMRVKARWEALDEESIQMAHARACGKIYHAPVFENGDSRKQLLARSIYLLYKKESLWTESQRVRAGILFREYPDIKKAYYLSMRLGLIYQQCRHKDVALTRLARWYDEVDKSGFLAFGRVARSIQTHYLEIINFFEKRSTNAASESFNAKIKNFRAQFRGVKGKAFFLYRLTKMGQRNNLRGKSDKFISLPERKSAKVMETSGYRLLLPEGTLDYFIISDVKESSTEIVIYLEEKNEVPGEYSSMQVESKGFYEPVVVQDFPIRGKKLFLNIRRRRWIVKDEGRYVSRNWKLVAEGSRITHDFASFLKELY